MKAIIKLDVPEFQIGEEVSVYFKDTMMTKGICAKDELIHCKDCVHFYPKVCACDLEHRPLDDDWHCADAEREEVKKPMSDLERIITVLEDQINLCGTGRTMVYMTADDSKRIIEWLKRNIPQPVHGQTYCRCFGCGSMLYERNKFCTNCGQAINWNNK